MACEQRAPGRRVRRWLAPLTAALLLTSLAAAAAAQEGAAPVRVVVAVLPFEVHSAQPLDHLEQSLADLLATRLEASGRVEVLGRIADQLGIPFYVVDFEQDFRSLVVDDFVNEYYSGRTPNPCARCNRLVKFGLLLDKACGLGADCMATGHYARIERGDDGFFQLLKGRDSKKDQSYFLFGLTQAQLSRSLFPLGALTKPEVRELAARFDLRVAEKKESQEICFIPDDVYVRFIEGERDLGDLSGDIVTREGAVVGRHRGAHRYTVGQRGLCIAWKEPLYVLDVDAARRRVVVGPKEELYRTELTAADLNWIMPLPDAEFATSCRIRYRDGDSEGPARGSRPLISVSRHAGIRCGCTLRQTRTHSSPT